MNSPDKINDIVNMTDYISHTCEHIYCDHCVDEIWKAVKNVYERVIELEESNK